jgi:hypothetical protein
MRRQRSFPPPGHWPGERSARCGAQAERVLAAVEQAGRIMPPGRGRKMAFKSVPFLGSENEASKREDPLCTIPFGGPEICPECGLVFGGRLAATVAPATRPARHARPLRPPVRPPPARSCRIRGRPCRTGPRCHPRLLARSPLRARIRRRARARYLKDNACLLPHVRVPGV